MDVARPRLMSKWWKDLIGLEDGIYWVKLVKRWCDEKGWKW
jgi:hypothetical protein